MKKNTRYIWLTLSFLALALALVLMLPHMPKEKTPPPTDHRSVISFPLINKPLATLATIAIHPNGETPYVLTYQNQALQYEGRSINALHAELMLSAVSTLLAEDDIGEIDAELQAHLGDMGLDTPMSVVTITYTDNTAITLSFGNLAPLTTSHYVRIDNHIYLCNFEIAEVFSMRQNRLWNIAQPTLEKTLITSATLTPAHAPAMKILFQDDETHQGATLQTPFVYPLAQEEAENLRTALANLQLGTHEGTVEAMDAPLYHIEIEQKAGLYQTTNEHGQVAYETLPAQTFSFAIGHAEGDHFYTCAYRGSLYWVNRLFIDTIIALTPDALLTKTPFQLPSLQSIQLETKEGLVDISVERTERIAPNNEFVLDENGLPIVDIAVFVNGNPVPLPAWEAFEKRLYAYTTLGSTTSVDGLTPTWTLQLTTTDQTKRVVQGYSQDVFSDALAIDGVVKHYADKEALRYVFGEWLP